MRNVKLNWKSALVMNQLEYAVARHQFGPAKSLDEGWRYKFLLKVAAIKKLLDSGLNTSFKELLPRLFEGCASNYLMTRSIPDCFFK